MKAQIKIKLVKLTMHWPEAHSAITVSLTALSLDLFRVNASALLRMVKYAICACQSMSNFWVNPHEYVTLSA